MDLTDFDDWARVTAQLRLVPAAKRSAFLARLGVVAAWAAADEEHKAALVEALAGGDMEHAFRLNRVCDEVTSEGIAALALDGLNKTKPPRRAPKAPKRDDFRHNVLYGAPKKTDRCATKGPSGGSFRALVKGSGAAVEPPNAILRQTIPIHALSAAAVEPIKKAANPAQQGPEVTPADEASSANTSEPLTEAWGSGPLAAFDWKLEQYARFCAYLERAPDDIRSVCMRCGIHDERVYNYVHQVWHERLQADPAVNQKFHWLMSKERQTLDSTGDASQP